MVRDNPIFTYKFLSEVVLEKASSGTLCIALLLRYKVVRRCKLLNVLLCKNRNLLLFRCLQQKKKILVTLFYDPEFLLSPTLNILHTHELVASI